MLRIIQDRLNNETEEKMDALDTYLFLFGAKTYFIASLY